MGIIYKIGELSKMVGIAPQTIRFYEKYGILANDSTTLDYPIKYSLANLMTLIITRRYRNSGFTLSESGEMLMNTSKEKLSGIIQKQINSLDYEIELLTRIRNNLLRQHNELSMISKELGSYSICHIPDRYGTEFLQFGETENTYLRNTRLLEWVKMQPLAEISNFFYLDDNKQFCNRNTLGFIIDKDDAIFMDVPQREDSFLLPGGQALHVIHSIPSVNNAIEKYIDDKLMYASDNDYCYKGLPHGRLIVSVYHGCEHPYYIQLWLPLENKGTE